MGYVGHLVILEVNVVVLWGQGDCGMLGIGGSFSRKDTHSTVHLEAKKTGRGGVGDAIYGIPVNALVFVTD